MSESTLSLDLDVGIYSHTATERCAAGLIPFILCGTGSILCTPLYTLPEERGICSESSARLRSPLLQASSVWVHS